MGITPFILSMLLSGGTGQQPATGTNGSASQEQRPAATAEANPDSLPVSLDKIQKALGQKPRIVVKDADYYSDSGLPTFRIGIEGQRLTIAEILGPNLTRGPFPAGAMTHQEFVNLV